MHEDGNEKYQQGYESQGQKAWQQADEGHQDEAQDGHEERLLSLQEPGPSDRVLCFKGTL